MAYINRYKGIFCFRCLQDKCTRKECSCGENRKDVERYLCKRVKELGGKAYKFVSPGNAGVPDRVIIIPVQTDLGIGLTYFAEVKKPGELPRPLQKVVMRQMAHKGANVFTVATYEDVDDACEDMKKDRRDIEVAVRYAEKRGVL